jgi:protein-S-isoprenylcysteine O-methyltransferase Ste14
MIMGFLTNASGTLVPALLACAITYIFLITVTERSLSYRHLFIAFLITWLMSTATGYLIVTRNFIHVAIAFAVLATFLVLRGRKEAGSQEEPDE